MRASPFAELDADVAAKQETLKVRVRTFAAERPLAGLMHADESDDEDTVFPWDDDPGDGDVDAEPAHS